MIVRLLVIGLVCRWKARSVFNSTISPVVLIKVVAVDLTTSIMHAAA